MEKTVGGGINIYILGFQMLENIYEKKQQNCNFQEFNYRLTTKKYYYFFLSFVSS